MVTAQTKTDTSAKLFAQMLDNRLCSKGADPNRYTTGLRGGVFRDKAEVVVYDKLSETVVASRSITSISSDGLDECIAFVEEWADKLKDVEDANST